MNGRSFAVFFSLLYVKRGEERGGAVTLVIMRHRAKSAKRAALVLNLRSLRGLAKTGVR